MPISSINMKTLTEVINTRRALCKINGMLVIAEFVLNKGKSGCPNCRKDNFDTRYGWIECGECGFGILESDYKKFAKETGQE